MLCSPHEHQGTVARKGIKAVLGFLVTTAIDWVLQDWSGRRRTKKRQESAPRLTHMLYNLGMNRDLYRQNRSQGKRGQGEVEVA